MIMMTWGACCLNDESFDNWRGSFGVLFRIRHRYVHANAGDSSVVFRHPLKRMSALTMLRLNGVTCHNDDSLPTLPPSLEVFELEQCFRCVW